jgi:Kef-type K+ transport system membrane component KefB
LGTTFFVLKTQSEKEALDLSSTLIGAILQGAALIDDIIALVLLSVITALGQGDGDGASAGAGLGWTIGRPIVASAALALVSPLVTFYLARPLWRRTPLEKWCERGGPDVELFVGVAVLAAYLAIAYYAQTTMLLGAFLAGVFLFALPSPTSTVNFAKTYDRLVEPVQRYVSLCRRGR